MTITPRVFTEKILAPKMLGRSNEDITVLRVEVRGMKDKKATKYTWQMVDLYDHGRNITSMAKTTAIPAALMAKWIALKTITETGVVPIESLIVRERFQPFIEEMSRLGINIDFNEEVNA
jgi:lysine 6-dehydrogenase